MPISLAMRPIDGWWFHPAACGDAIVNNPLMEIATGQSLCLLGLQADDKNGGLQSVACGLAGA